MKRNRALSSMALITTVLLPTLSGCINTPEKPELPPLGTRPAMAIEPEPTPTDQNPYIGTLYEAGQQEAEAYYANFNRWSEEVYTPRDVSVLSLDENGGGNQDQIQQIANSLDFYLQLMSQYSDLPHSVTFQCESHVSGYPIHFDLFTGIIAISPDATMNDLMSQTSRLIHDIVSYTLRSESPTQISDPQLLSLFGADDITSYGLALHIEREGLQIQQNDMYQRFLKEVVINTLYLQSAAYHNRSLTNGVTGRTDLQASGVGRAYTIFAVEDKSDLDELVNAYQTSNLYAFYYALGLIDRGDLTQENLLDISHFNQIIMVNPGPAEEEEGAGMIYNEEYQYGLNATLGLLLLIKEATSEITFQ